MKKPKRYRAIKTKDCSSPGDYSWVVFDITQVNARGEFTYIADCISAKAARLVAEALNNHVIGRSHRTRGHSQRHSGK